jgi:AmiR/NasT family two-component response regulator
MGGTELGPAALLLLSTAGKVRMAQRSPPRCALIVEDEVFFAISLEADMHELGFDVCDLAANGQQASTLAMNNQPDVVLMDINLEGGREGIEVARWLHTVCDASIVFITGYADRDTVERIHQKIPGAPVLPKPFYHGRLADAVATAVAPRP